MCVITVIPIISKTINNVPLLFQDDSHTSIYFNKVYIKYLYNYSCMRVTS